MLLLAEDEDNFSFSEWFTFQIIIWNQHIDGKQDSKHVTSIDLNYKNVRFYLRNSLPQILLYFILNHDQFDSGLTEHVSGILSSMVLFFGNNLSDTHADD